MRELLPLLRERLHTVPRFRTFYANLRTFGHRTAQLKILLPKPRLLQVWITTARRAQVWLGLILFLLVVVAPPTVSALSDYLYPPVTREKKILGFFQRTQTVPNPLRQTRYGQFMTSLWTAGLGLVLVQLINHIPAAIAIGRRRAVSLREQADRIVLEDPARSAQLRKSALDFMIDSRSEGGSRDFAAAAPDVPEPTKVISASAVPGRTPQYIGVDGRYRLDKAIGSGGMGVVHSAYDTVLKRPVAVKQLFAHLVQDSEQTERFRQEALALASLSHPSIVTAYDLLKDSGHFWIVMELLTGGSLAQRIAGVPHLEIGESVAVTSHVAAALGFAHEKGIIHRDVKPPNILFTTDGLPKLTDFGNAKLAESVVHTQEGLMLGSPAYMSPEQITGHTLDHRTDIYSLGISLYQMLTGRVPFEGELRTILAQHVSQTPRPPSELNPSVPEDLDTTVLMMLSKAPQERFQDIASVVSALNEVTAHAEKCELVS